MFASWTHKLRESLPFGREEVQYSRLNQEKEGGNSSQDGSLRVASSPSSSSPSRSQSYQRRRSMRRLGGGVFAIFLILSLGLLYRKTTGPDSRQIVFNPETPIKSEYFHLIIPAGTDGTCRTLFSAGALNYPVARIVNFLGIFEDSSKVNDGYDLHKIAGALDYLHRLDGHSDNDLVLMPDGADTWFQLRPEVLIQRYHAIVKRLDKQAKLRYKSAAYRHNIIFSAQSSCEESHEDSLECFIAAPPDSPNTTLKPRYLNTGLVMGTVKAVKALFEQAHYRLDQPDRHYTSDQQVLTEIFGEQEFSREKKLAEKAPSNTPPPFSDLPPNKNLDCGTNNNCQYQIGLDYQGLISMAAEIASSNLLQPQISPNLPQDILHSTPPFWTPDYSGSTRLPHSTPWTQIPLLTHTETAIRPATIHHSTPSSPHNLTQSWQDTFWPLPHLRTILTAQAKSPRIPFAVLRDPSNGQATEYWGPSDGYGGARCHLPKKDQGEWKQWDEICSGEEEGEGLMGDGLGAWVSPIYYLFWQADKQAWQIEQFQERRKWGQMN